MKYKDIRERGVYRFGYDGKCKRKADDSSIKCGPAFLKSDTAG